MACITISESRKKKTYVLLNKNDIINVSIDGLDEVMVIKAKRGKLCVKSEKKTPADRQLESQCLSHNERRKKRRSERNGVD